MKLRERMAKISPTDLIIGLLSEKGASGKPNEPIDRIRLMKALFLLSQEESQLQGIFKFEPYLYGAVSFEVYDCLRSLQAKGIVTTTNENVNERWNRYYLTSTGTKVAQSLNLPKKLLRKSVPSNSTSLPKKPISYFGKYTPNILILQLRA